jgi:deoxyribonuclease V
MYVHQFHSWEVTPQEAIQIQEQLRAKIITRGRVSRPRLVAGADCAFDGRSDRAYVAVVVLTFPGLEPVEEAVLTDHVTFPYIPGFLSFREAPALLRVFAKLKHDPDVIFIDGHGLSHPRSAGIACHIGVLLDRPTVGCAKSLLVGTYKDPTPLRGSVSPLYDGNGLVVGAALRTRDRVRPVFVSVGHRIGLAQAVQLVLSCGKGYRVPEPTRQADLLAGLAKRNGGGHGSG